MDIDEDDTLHLVSEQGFHHVIENLIFKWPVAAQMNDNYTRKMSLPGKGFDQGWDIFHFALAGRVDVDLLAQDVFDHRCRALHDRIADEGGARQIDGWRG